MAGPSIGTWVKVKNKSGRMTSRVIPNKFGGGGYKQGQVITQSEFKKIQEQRAKGSQEKPRRLLASEKKLERLEREMDSLTQQSKNIPGSFEAGRSGYGMGKKRDAMNNRMADKFRDLQQTKDRVARLRSWNDFKSDKVAAKALWKEQGKAMVDHYVGTMGKSKKDVRDALDQMAKWEPAKFKSLFEKYSTRN